MNYLIKVIPEKSVDFIYFSIIQFILNINTFLADENLISASTPKLILKM